MRILRNYWGVRHLGCVSLFIKKFIYAIIPIRFIHIFIFNLNSRKVFQMNFKNIKALFVASTLILATPVFAQTPSDESLNKMMSLMKIEQNLKEMQETMPQMLEQMLQHSFDQDPRFKQVSPQKREKIQAILKKFAHEAMTESMGNQEMLNAMFTSFNKIAKRHYTQAEVDAMNAFLSTPEGASITQKQGKVMAEFMPDFMQNIAPIQNKILNDKITQANAEIHALMEMKMEESKSSKNKKSNKNKK